MDNATFAQLAESREVQPREARHRSDGVWQCASRFERTPEDVEAGLSELSAFLSHAALEAGEAQAEVGQDCVQLMTLHSAKGLEFPLVFLVGLEDGLFPSHKSVEEPGRLEEERRLAYVGITRAREHLILCYAETRRMHGMEMYGRPSRFIGEIPRDLRTKSEPRVQVTDRCAKAHTHPADGSATFKLGQRVSHAHFAMAWSSTTKAAAPTRACRSISRVPDRNGGCSPLPI